MSIICHSNIKVILPDAFQVKNITELNMQIHVMTKKR